MVVIALAETANLMVKLSLGGNFVGQLNKAGAAVGKFEGKTNRAYKAGQQIGTGIKRGALIAAAGVGILASQVAVGLQSLIKLEQAEAQTAAVLKSTGGAARINGAEVTRLAEKYEGLNAVVGDEFIRAGENMLLTFTNIKGKAFEPALAAILDMNTAMGKGPEGLTKTAILVGKALNDPAKGMTALTRNGVTFTKGQIKTIKALQKSGDLLGAQKIVLAELNKEFGTSFLAQGNTTAGKVAKFGDAIEDLQRSLAVALLPTVSNVADALTTLLQDKATIKGAEDIGKAIGEVFSAQNIKTGAAAVGDAFKVVQGAMPAIKAGLQGVASLVGGAVAAFRSLPPEIQALAVGGFTLNKLTGGLVTNIGGGLIGAVLGKLRSAVVNVQGGVVNVSGGVGGAAGGAAGVAKGGLGLASKVFLVGEAIGLGLAVNEVRQGISDASTAQATAISDQTSKFIATQPSRAAVENALAGVNQGIHDLESNPLNVLVQGDALDQLRAMRANLKAQLGAPAVSGTVQQTDTKGKLTDSFDRAKIPAVTTKLDALKDSFDRSVIPTTTAIGAVTTAVGTLDSTTSTHLTGVTAKIATIPPAQAAAASSIVGAIRASTPTVITNVTVSANSVTKTVTVTRRYGQPSGSRDTPAQNGAR